MRCTVTTSACPCGCLRWAPVGGKGEAQVGGKVRRRYADQYLTPGQGSRLAGVPAVGEVQVGGQLPDAGQDAGRAGVPAVGEVHEVRPGIRINT